MRRFLAYATALLVVLAASVGVAQSPEPENSPLDSVMRRIGPAMGRLFLAVSNGQNLEARGQIPALKKDIAEAEAFFASRKREDGVKFAKEAVAKFDALDRALAAAPAVPNADPYVGTANVNEAMKNLVGPNATGVLPNGTRQGESVGALITAGNYAQAAQKLGVIRSGIVEAEKFFTGRKEEQGIGYAKDTIAKLDSLVRMLNANPQLGQSEIVAANRELTTTCGACHTTFRTREEGGEFVLRPGTAPPLTQVAAVDAVREVQTACTSCHNSYRVNFRGALMLKGGT